MRTHSLKSQSVNSTWHGAARGTPSPACASGMVSELVYSQNQPGMTQLLLLPLLQQLSTQSRWQLWLNPQQKLSRHWLLQSGLPLEKMMQAPHSGSIATVEAMIKALQTGNYSVVLGWFDEEISEIDRQRLEQAAGSGQALGLIMRPERSVSAQERPLKGLKIHSSLYH
ncbi:MULTISPECIES: SOS-induced cell division inhibitor SulA [unclassified Erwinia]|uniref:SOS-induced cell division inhibitor SulA n=1 Tax=unclassified Erwinia TaxID=2622719 RepID=UPI0007016E66|nr:MULTISPECIES: SOS-induced cell division inhibitor SulA [unclassified Erwinia]KQN56992.1 CDP-tyvelose epimerase [Erwinia sp. Leaf53]PLV62220.1 CDP-tyvelose epimerase [Erwinia sp. B116]